MRLATLLALLLVVTACGTPEPQPTPGVLTLGMRDPGSALADRMIRNALYSPLIDYDPVAGRITALQAESVTSTDQRTWTIKLRPARYHDGTPVTAKSYVDAWTALGDQLPVAYQEIVPVDELTIRLVAKAPASYLPSFLASTLAAPVKITNGSPVGTGAFRLEGWQNGKGGKLIRVDQVGTKAKQIDLRVYGELGAAFDEVKAGKLDLVVDFPGNRHQSMHQDFADRYLTWPKPEAGYLVFGADAGNAGARFAIAMALDRKKLTEDALDNQADPATRLYPPVVSLGERSGACRPCNFDPAAAKSLRTQSDLVNILIGPNEPLVTAIIEQLRDNLGVPASTSNSAAQTARLFIQQWQTDSPHELFRGLELPGVQPFLDTAATSGNPEERAQNYRLAENELLRELPIVPLWTAHGHAVWGSRVHDVTAAARHGIDLTAITL